MDGRRGKRLWQDSRFRVLSVFRRYPLVSSPVAFARCCSLAAFQCYPLVMTIALAKDVEEFLLEQVRAGVAGDPSELANDVLRCVRDQQRRPFELTLPQNGRF